MASKDPLLHLMIFHQQKPSRVFEVSHSWFLRLGWLLILALLITLGSISFAVRSAYIQKNLDPSHLRYLEAQIASLKQSLQDVQSNSRIPEPTAPSPSPTPTSAESSPSIDSKLPSLHISESVPQSSAPLAVTQPQVQWRDGKAVVKFNLEYQGNDGGSQQGRILIIGQGRGRFVVYPTSALSISGSISLLPDQGEYFSVSRLRVTNAELPGFPTRSDFDHADVYIYDNSGKMIFQTRLTVKATKPTYNPEAPAAPATPVQVPTPPLTPTPPPEAAGETL
jgi:hypothetical protein